MDKRRMGAFSSIGRRPPSTLRPSLLSRVDYAILMWRMTRAGERPQLLANKRIASYLSTLQQQQHDNS